jgi:hypothetical protein
MTKTSTAQLAVCRPLETTTEIAHVPGSRECLTSWFRSIYRGEIAEKSNISCWTSDPETEVPHRGMESGGAAEKESDSRFGFPIWDEAVFARGSGDGVIAALAGVSDILDRQRRSVKGWLDGLEPTGRALRAASQSNQWRISLCRAATSRSRMLGKFATTALPVERRSAPVLTADHLPNRCHDWILQGKIVNTYFAIH